MLASHAGCELHQGHDHGEGGSLDGDKGLVHVDAHGVGNVEEGFSLFGTKNAADNLDQQLLGVACAKVEANRFENQSLETNDDFARRFEDLYVCLLVYVGRPI